MKTHRECGNGIRCSAALTKRLLLFFGKSRNGFDNGRSPSSAGREHPALILKIRIQHHFRQVALFELSFEHEMRSPGQMVRLDRHPLDEVVIVRQEGFELSLLPIAR